MLASRPHCQQLELERLHHLEVGQDHGYGRPYFSELTTEALG